MYQQPKLERGRHGESRGDGKLDPSEDDIIDDLDDDLGDQEDLDASDLPPIPGDDDDLDLSWGSAKMPDFSDDDSTPLQVARADNKDVYAAADAVDSTDATVIADENKDLDKKAGRGSAWIPLVIIVAVLALAVGAWLLFGSAVSDLFGGDPAARVNGDVITVAELDLRFQLTAAQNPSLFDPELGGAEEGVVRQHILGSMVDELLLLQEAGREGVRVSNDAVQEEITLFVASYPEPEMFEEELRDNNLTREMFEEQVRQAMTFEALIEALVPAESVTDQDVSDYYQRNIEVFVEPAAKRTSHILLPLDDRARGTDLLVELRDSSNLEADFARIAEESSADAMSAVAGGDAGWPRHPEQRPEAYVRAIADLDVGDLSDLVRTEEGYFIILVTDEREATQRTLEEATPGIRDLLLGTMRNQMYSDLLERLRAEAEIEVLDPEILAFEARQADEVPDAGESGLVPTINEEIAEEEY